ncbi:PREDICTED: probable receptor-like protein kinase At1g11050 [Fragaria vesca subsp. vesca]|uniref:probable receptor-like protein kinase At1g11050 n=1 Tax=Fragaria vesca subsp. vesca TaxID=101020 RepID=UPI0002C36B03|nr:PREDICTED: probable receptor-like protein kinase At1g11050 [Fragaria vesca subsp. vesca]
MTSARHFTILFIATFLVQALSLSLSPDDGSGSCVLNFTSYPYQPTGECISPAKLRIKVWDSFTLPNLCCRNVLTTLSQALACQAFRTQGGVFVSNAEWINCTGSFVRQDVSAVHCSLNDLYDGSSDCSKVNLAEIKQGKEYQDALNFCSQFGNASSSFDAVCTPCSAAVGNLKQHLLDRYHQKNDNNKTEDSICGVAAVISVAAGNISNAYIDDYFGCMTKFDKFEPGYFKLKYSLVEAILSIMIAITGLVLIVMLIKHVTKKKPLKPILSGSTTTTWSGLYRFSKAEIENAINYGPERKHLGRGSAGHVYKGVLPSGQVVAVKHINKSNISDSFTREVEQLSRVRHPNLVCLFGCCVEDGEQYLVYEYCSSGNLAQHLLRNDPVLTWERRVKILRDCALALRYLHHYIDGCIVHRDIKLTNILLTENLDPKLSDFGLAKMLGMEESKVFTDVRGTIGYMDPEYMTNAKLTCASDVYSFGIVTLQLLSGQKVFELDLDARDQLTRKAKDVSLNKRPPEDLEDPRLNGNVNKADFDSILQIAVLCVAKSSKGRPTVDDVFEEMDKAWKNTVAEMKAQRGMSSSATPLSLSLGVLSV